MDNCILCGCTEDNACYHDNSGNCWWMSHNPPICSHCWYHDELAAADRPLTNSNILDHQLLRKVFKAKGIKVSIRRPSKKHVYNGQRWFITIKEHPSLVSLNGRWLKAFFRVIESTGSDSWSVDPNSNILNMEVSNA